MPMSRGDANRAGPVQIAAARAIDTRGNVQRVLSRNVKGPVAQRAGDANILVPRIENARMAASSLRREAACDSSAWVVH